MILAQMLLTSRERSTHETMLDPAEIEAGRERFKKGEVCMIFRLLTILPVVLFVMGCELFDTADGIRIRLDQSIYETGHSVGATFINDSDHVVYRIRPSASTTALEKLSVQDWVSLRSSGIGGSSPVVRFYKVQPGESIRFEYSYSTLKQMTSPVEGTYRFSETISSTPDYSTDRRVIRSATFVIE